MFTNEVFIDIAAPAERVWQIMADVSGWARWNAGVASATLHGPFASGSRFDMQLPEDGPLLHSTLIDVRPNAGFTDETAFEGVVVRVTHTIAPLPAGGVRVTYRTEVVGPGATEVGTGVSADFPQVLAALKHEAETPPAATALHVNCRCGAARLDILGAPLAQIFCHCDDCREAHDAAYVAAAIYPAAAVQVAYGDLVSRIVRDTPRMACRACGTHLFSELSAMHLRSVNGFRLPPGAFRPQMHVQCQHAVLPVVDNLPHFKAFPAAFGGSDDVVAW